jgi:hypothetical protein
MGWDPEKDYESEYHSMRERLSELHDKYLRMKKLKEKWHKKAKELQKFLDDSVSSL